MRGPKYGNSIGVGVDSAVLNTVGVDVLGNQIRVAVGEAVSTGMVNTIGSTGEGVLWQADMVTAIETIRITVNQSVVFCNVLIQESIILI